MINDTDGNRMLNAGFSLTDSEVKTATVSIECQSGFQLSGIVTPDLVIEARKAGAVSWVDIETTPIDLSADAGTFQNYEIRFTAGTVTARARRLFRLRVEPFTAPVSAGTVTVGGVPATVGGVDVTV